MKVVRALALILLIAPVMAGGPAALSGSTAPDVEARSLDQAAGDTRTDAWSDVARLASEARGEAVLAGWAEADVNTPDGDARGALRSSSTDFQDVGGVEILIRTWYDPVARDHVLRQGLQSRSSLDAMRANITDRAQARRSIPPFPDGSRIVLTAWWPAAGDRVTALPVWDPGENMPVATGNHYLTWQRVLLVGGAAGQGAHTLSGVFADREFGRASAVPLDRFVHQRLGPSEAEDFMLDPRRRKAAIIALGRPLATGDVLLLVAVNMAVKSHGRWRWRTLWWHDRPEEGTFAAGRPASIQAPWSNYLLDVAQDPLDLPPKERDRVAVFNPWLEARFPAGPHGGGTASNCASCHRRASYPPANFLPVGPATPDIERDPAFASDRLATDMVWGIARRAR